MDFRQAFDDESFGDADGLVSRAESRIDRTTADVKGRIAVFIAAQALFKDLGNKTSRPKACAMARTTIATTLGVDVPPKLALALKQACGPDGDDSDAE